MVTLVRCPCRLEGVLGTLELKMTSLVWTPEDWAQATETIGISDITGMRKDNAYKSSSSSFSSPLASTTSSSALSSASGGGRRGPAITIQRYDGRRYAFEAPLENADDFMKLSQRLSDIRSLQFKPSSTASHLHKTLTKKNSILASYWKETDRYSQQHDGDSSSESNRSRKSHSRQGSSDVAPGSTDDSRATYFPTQKERDDDHGLFGTAQPSAELVSWDDPSFEDDNHNHDFGHDRDERATSDNDHAYFAEQDHMRRDAHDPYRVGSGYDHFSEHDSDPSRANMRSSFPQHYSSSSNNNSSTHAHMDPHHADRDLDGDDLSSINDTFENMHHRSAYGDGDDVSSDAEFAHVDGDARGQHLMQGPESSTHDERSRFDSFIQDDELTAMELEHISRGPLSEECSSTGILLNARTLVGGKACTLRYSGLVHFEAGEWCGVEFDEPLGDCDGAISGVRYFQCYEGHGKFVPVKQVKPTKEMMILTQYGLRIPLIMPRPEWEEDKPQCHFCKRAFTTRRRHHHCRGCGHVCCNSCSPRERHLPYLSYASAERVCKSCEVLSRIVWHASGTMIRDGKIEMAETSRAQLQLRIQAAQELRDMAHNRHQTLIDYPPCLAVLINLCISPFDDLQAYGVTSLHALANIPSCRGTLVALGLFRGLTNILKTNSDGKTFSTALITGFTIIKECPQYTGDVLQSGLLFAVIQLMSEATGNAQRTCSWIFKFLAKKQKTAPLMLEDLQSIRTVYSAIPRMKSNPQAQESLLCGLAFVSSNPSTLQVLNEVHSQMSYVICTMLPDLIVLAKSGGMQDQTYRRRALVHVACWLANLAAESNIPTFTLMKYADNVIHLLGLRNAMPELKLHTTRALINLTRNEQLALYLTRHCALIAQPLKQVSDRQLKLYILKTLENIACVAVDKLRVGLADYVDELHRLAQLTTDADLAEIARNVLLSLGFDVMTEARRYTPQDLNESMTACDALIVSPSRFLDISDDEIVQNASQEAFQPYTPLKSKKESMGAAILDRLLMVLNENQVQAAKYQEMMSSASEAEQEYVVEITKERYESTIERISQLDRQIESLRPLLVPDDNDSSHSQKGMPAAL